MMDKEELITELELDFPWRPVIMTCLLKFGQRWDGFS